MKSLNEEEKREARKREREREASQHMDVYGKSGEDKEAQMLKNVAAVPVVVGSVRVFSLSFGGQAASTTGQDWQVKI